MSGKAPQYRFGPFEIHLETRKIYKSGTKLKLRPQAFLILQRLAEAGGNVVSREELQKTLWPDNTFVDFEHGLNNSIKELRSVLCDSASAPQFIETLPRLGYRMIVPVQEGSAGESCEAAPETSQAAEASTGGPALEDRPRDFRASGFKPALAASILVLIAGIVAYSGWRVVRVRPSEASEKVRLAVLPFENLTGDPGQEYVSDGLTEEMIARLGQADLDRLEVIARTSVMHYKKNRTSLDEIGEALHVQYLLEGSVRRDSRRVRISVQLIKAGSQTPLWSRQYDRETSDLLTLQGEVAQEVSEELRQTLGGAKSQPYVKPSAATPESQAAQDLYFKGTYFLNKRNAKDIEHSIGYFEQAIAKGPNFAPAFAGLSYSYALLSGYSGEMQGEFMRKAKAAAVRALELDGSLPEAHTALALTVQNYDWDWSTAEKEYRRAIELNPNYATAHHWYAEHLAFRGRFDQALAESERALRLDPLSLIIPADRGVIYYYARRYDDSIRQFLTIGEVDPGFARAAMIIYPFVEGQYCKEALAAAQKFPVPDSRDLWYWAETAYVDGRCGKRNEALRAMQKLVEQSGHRAVDPGVFLIASLGAGDTELSSGWLQKAYAQHSNVLVTLKVDPAYDPLRSDPRFQEMLHRVGLDQ